MNTRASSSKPPVPPKVHPLNIILEQRSLTPLPSGSTPSRKRSQTTPVRRSPSLNEHHHDNIRWPDFIGEEAGADEASSEARHQLQALRDELQCRRKKSADSREKLLRQEQNEEGLETTRMQQDSTGVAERVEGEAESQKAATGVDERSVKTRYSGWYIKD